MNSSNPVTNLPGMVGTLSTASLASSKNGDAVERVPARFRAPLRGKGLWRLLKNVFPVLLVLLAGPGCDPATKQLPPLALDQVPAALEKAFSKAETETKELADSVAAFVRAQDYSKAYVSLETLLGKPKLSREQSQVTARSILTVNQALQEAQQKGDAAAAETLQYNQKNR
jgi:hypothetical protein